MAMARSPAGLVAVTLPQSSRKLALAKIEGVSDIEEDASVFADLPLRIQRYFEGERVIFPEKLDIGGATEFQRAVWEMTRTILFGETRSYGWVAERIGRPRACRAVGTALARNSLSIIVPCHRVIAADGRCGGFSGGDRMKKQLLRREGMSLPD